MTSSFPFVNELNSVQHIRENAALGKVRNLIEAAEAELIAGHGQFEMQAVAKRAHVSVGLAYHHFGSKAGLIAAVVEAFYQRLDEAVFSNIKWPSESWAERERGRIGAYIAFHYADPFALLVIGSMSRAPEVLDVEKAFTDRQLAAGARMLDEARRLGVISDDADPHLTIAMMIGGIRQAVVGALMQDPRPDPENLTNDIWAFMSAALRLTKGKSSV
ncbi:TetR/AcrR family transcriptional regulator [Pelagibacterium flavum]|uniref:TetR/AcrR family transcriptional regulator n=1 Tax=Pelagibacterium flavum TaxID=2984530 RepID=A0ABY6ISZ1_9HYPH|nr:TetR/AcrR family transcriptional regulator [Pelagibacterium sp. YIM 151497]UYQ73529.1 TetR/AcrR family transcriptional regulator [Pelagibacterium sp. YIM 151497]